MPFNHVTTLLQTILLTKQVALEGDVYVACWFWSQLQKALILTLGMEK